MLITTFVNGCARESPNLLSCRACTSPLAQALLTQIYFLLSQNKRVRCARARAVPRSPTFSCCIDEVNARDANKTR